ERLANEAERELARIDAQREKLQERIDHVSERIDDLRRDLERLEGEQTTAAAALTAIEAERSDAASRAKSTARDAERARSAVAE
ncbi:MAG: transposase, partial [Microbacterium sp.]